jgi:hypothetical protein
MMGVREFAGRARGSWQLLREEYSPVRTLSVGLAARTGAKQIASVSIRTRDDLPSYTLRGYVLRWQTMSVGGKKFAAGRVTLPTLVPGSRWSGKATMSVPVGSYRVVVSIVRPTGFDVTRQTYAGDGRPTSRD